MCYSNSSLDSSRFKRGKDFVDKVRILLIIRGLTHFGFSKILSILLARTERDVVLLEGSGHIKQFSTVRGDNKMEEGT